MAKRDRGQGTSAGSPDSPAAQTTMDQFLKDIGLDDYGVSKRATLNIWNPEKGEVRAFTYEGEEIRKSAKGDFAGSEYAVHYGVDLKTGDDFSFIGGGLFSFTVRDKGIEKGTPLVVQYLGMVDIEEGSRRAKQWDIRILKRK